MRALFGTKNLYSLTVIRVVVGIVFLIHGSQLMLGWFGGSGFTRTMAGFTGSGIPWIFALLAICAEFFGGLGLVVGLLGRIAAFGILCTMVVAIATAHLQNGFFMNWTGKQLGEGFEYHILVIAICLAVTISGSGAMSLDRLISGGGPRE